MRIQLSFKVLRRPLAMVFGVLAFLSAHCSVVHAEETHPLYPQLVQMMEKYMHLSVGEETQDAFAIKNLIDLDSDNAVYDDVAKIHLAGRYGSSDLDITTKSLLVSRTLTLLKHFFGSEILTNNFTPYIDFNHDAGLSIYDISELINYSRSDKRIKFQRLGCAMSRAQSVSGSDSYVYKVKTGNGFENATVVTRNVGSFYGQKLEENKVVVNLKYCKIIK